MRASHLAIIEGVAERRGSDALPGLIHYKAGVQALDLRAFEKSASFLARALEDPSLSRVLRTKARFGLRFPRLAASLHDRKVQWARSNQP